MNFKAFDGTGRVPRDVQNTALGWLSDNWNEYDILGLSAPVGSGKSAIARAVQIAGGAHITTPSNVLVDQYSETYPDVNFLKGRKHYFCEHMQEPCMAKPTKGCGDCPYRVARQNAVELKDTFFNPMSLYFQLKGGLPRPETLVVDEFHQLPAMIMLLCGKKFRYSEYKFTRKCEEETYLIEWLGAQYVKAGKLESLYRRKGDRKKADAISDEVENLRFTRDAFIEDPSNYCVWIDSGYYRGRPETFLNVQPVKPPKSICRMLLNYKRLIFMSGTLFKCDIDDILDGTLEYGSLDLPSPIPVSMRPIYYRPAPGPMNSGFDPRMAVTEIEKILDSRPGKNTIIHVPYSWVPRLAPLFSRPIITNTQEDKEKKIAAFKRDGGVFLAAGCSEGLDLRGDVARVNIIPHLLWPNLGDPVVRKRRDGAGGQLWYLAQTIKAVIQQYGRTSRDETDFSETFILDPKFSQIVTDINRRDPALIPKSFSEAIVWSGKGV